MDFDIYVKNKFLNKTMGEFTSEYKYATYNDIENIIMNNKSWYVPNSFIKKGRPIIESIFNSIDGRVLNKDQLRKKLTTTPVRHKDNLIEKAEIYQLIKDYFHCEKSIDLTNEQVSKLKIKDFLDIIVVFLEKSEM